MIDNYECYCPVCKSPLDPDKIQWSCPVCDTSNQGMVFNVCTHCKFGPRLFKCPRCGKHFEGLLLLGTFTGKKRTLILGKDLLKKQQFKIQLKDADFRISQDVERDQLLSMGQQGIHAMGHTEFLSPIKLSRFLLHSFKKASDDVYWIHGWGYSKSGWERTDEEDAQISI